MTNSSLVTIAIYLFLVLYFKDVLSTGEIEEKRKTDRYSPLWFGPRVGRKKRTLSDEVFRNLEREDVDTLADFIRKNPWAVIMFTSGNQHLFNLDGKVDFDDDIGEISNVVPRAMFAPRMERTSAFYPRLGRDNE